MRTGYVGMILLCAIAGSAPRGLAQAPPAGQGAAAERRATSPAALPKDVYADSRNRLPLVQRDELDEYGKKVYDAAAAQEGRSLGVQGPTGIRLYSPPVAEYMNQGNQYLRYQSGLEPRLVELTILVSAREMDSQFEWAAHQPAALKAGLDLATIDIIKHRRSLTGLGEKEAAIIRLGREALGKHQVSSDTFAQTLKLFGKQGLVNVVTLMAHYAATAALLTTFDQQLRPDQKPLLPIP